MESNVKGLVWVQKTFGLEPRWSFEPDLDALRQTLQSLKPAASLDVTFLAQGAFNKTYNVNMDGEELILRVTLPVDPHYKTLSEVATINWIHRITTLPVPDIITYSATRENPIGLEWILMSKIPGRPFIDCCKSIPFPAKARLVKQLATYSASLFQNPLRGIGNIYTELSTDSAAPNVDRIVSMHFFWGERLHLDCYRGPFPSSKDWMRARLFLSEHDCRSTLAKYESKDDLDSDDEDDVDDAKRTLNIIEKLEPVISLIFPADDDDEEPSMIFHDDLSRSNILVKDSGEISGILDWECVSALPLWKACDYPSFLMGPPRHLEPDISIYHRQEDGEPSELYWEHLWEYEATLLRQEFLNEMRTVEPKWVSVFDKSQVQKDLDIAVQSCGSEFVTRHINSWINDVTAGRTNLKSLRDRIDGT